MANPLVLIAVLLAGVAVLGLAASLVVSARAAMAGRPSTWGGRGILGWFGVLVIGLSLLVVSLDVDEARLAGVAGVVTGLGALALTTRVRAAPHD